MAKGVVQFGVLAKSAIKVIGEKVKPHLEQLYKGARSAYVSDYDKTDVEQLYKEACQAWEMRTKETASKASPPAVQSSPRQTAVNTGKQDDKQKQVCPPRRLALEHASFISDNPFRIVGDGSSITQQQLRQKAKGIETRAKAGIFEPSPLDNECGSQNLTEFASFVQVLANAPERRSAYRMMWPLSATLIPNLYTVKPFRTAGESPEELNQFYFLQSWLAFFRNPNGVRAQNTLMRWRTLLSDEKFCQRLSQMIQREDEIETDRALKILVQAQKLVTKQLLQQMVRSATTEWEANQTKNAIDILGAVSTSLVDEDVIFSSVGPFISIGESLQVRVQELISAITPYKIGDSLETPDEVQRLEGLATALKQWHPLTGVWMETIDNWHEIFG